MSRVAVLADVHGNLPALRAVLAAIAMERWAGRPVERVVCLGDVVAGPLPAACLHELQHAHVEVTWVRGNADREALEAYGGAEPADALAAHSAAQLGVREASWLQEAAAWVDVDGVRHCHGTPASDTGIVTRVSPPARVAAARDGFAGLVVGGHTHQQFAREGWANPGSVGRPYEGRTAAFWGIVEDGVMEHRETPYDVQAAIAELRTSTLGAAELEAVLAELVDPPDPHEVAARFEALAG